MNNTKFSIEIHANGTLNDAIVRMITNHNEGKTKIGIALLRRRAECYFAEWPGISPEFKMRQSIIDRTFDLFEGEKHILTVTEKTVEEERSQTVQPEYIGD